MGFIISGLSRKIIMKTSLTVGDVYVNDQFKMIFRVIEIHNKEILADYTRNGVYIQDFFNRSKWEESLTNTELFRRENLSSFFE